MLVKKLIMGLVNMEYPQNSEDLKVVVGNYPVHTYDGSKKQFKSMLLFCLVIGGITLFFPEFAARNILYEMPTYITIVCGFILLLKFKESRMPVYGYILQIVIAIAICQGFGFGGFAFLLEKQYTLYSTAHAVILMYLLYLVQLLYTIASIKSQSIKYSKILASKKTSKELSTSVLPGAFFGVGGYIASKFVISLDLLSLAGFLIVLFSIWLSGLMVSQLIVVYSQYDRINELREQLAEEDMIVSKGGS